MAEPQPVELREPGVTDEIDGEIPRLVGLVRRLERENASLRRALADARPLAA